MVRRVYVEKKPAYQVAAAQLTSELCDYLHLTDLAGVRVLIRYDIENVSEETYERAKNTIFSEPPVDDLYEETFPKQEGDLTFSVEYLPGQFDQRADSAEQCVKLLNSEENPLIRSAVTYVLSGAITGEEAQRIKAYCINPVDSRETDETKPATLNADYAEAPDVAIAEGFLTMDEDAFYVTFKRHCGEGWGDKSSAKSGNGTAVFGFGADIFRIGSATAASHNCQIATLP